MKAMKTLMLTTTAMLNKVVHVADPSASTESNIHGHRLVLPIHITYTNA